MLRGGKLDSAAFNYGLEVIERNAKTQSQLVEDLLEVSRIITGHLRLEIRPIDLVRTIQAAVEAVQPALDAKNITLEQVLDTTTKPRVPQSIMLDGLRVLLIEDDPDTRQLISFLLERQAAQVRSAESARAGLELLAEWRPDLIISDIGLPDEDGYFFIAQVRKLTSRGGGIIPAVALTAYAKSEDGERLIAAGFQKHVAKPVDPAELLKVVAQLVGRGKTSMQALE
jgi:CheY-like chemotaxis protein